MGAQPSTTYEALVAELLGDVGKVHETIQQLKEDIYSLPPVVDSLLEASEKLQEQSETFANSTKDLQKMLQHNENGIWSAIRKDLGTFAICALFAIIGGASCAVVGVWLLQPIGTSYLSEHARKLEAVWPRLDEKTREYIGKQIQVDELSDATAAKNSRREGKKGR